MSDELVNILWDQVLAAWGEEKRHQAFIGHCHEQGRLAEAARRYRALSEATAEPGFTELQRQDARARLAGITRLALTAITATPARDPIDVRKWLNIAALTLFVVTLGFLVLALLRMDGSALD